MMSWLVGIGYNVLLTFRYCSYVRRGFWCYSRFNGMGGFSLVWGVVKDLYF